MRRPGKKTSIKRGLTLTLLESNIVDTLVQVNGVFTGHDIVQSGSLLGGLGS